MLKKLKDLRYASFWQLWAPCFFLGFGIYFVVDNMYTRKYECVNTDTISYIDYYNSGDGYKFINKTVNFINVDNKSYVMFNQTIPINQPFECYIKNGIIIIQVDNTIFGAGIFMICLTVIWSIVMIYDTYRDYIKKPIFCKHK